MAAATLSSGLMRPSCSLLASCVVQAVSGSGKLSPSPAVLGSSVVAISFCVILSVSFLRYCKAVSGDLCYYLVAQVYHFLIARHYEASRGHTGSEDGLDGSFCVFQVWVDAGDLFLEVSDRFDGHTFLLFPA